MCFYEIVVLIDLVVFAIDTELLIVKNWIEAVRKTQHLYNWQGKSNFNRNEGISLLQLEKYHLRLQSVRYSVKNI